MITMSSRSFLLIRLDNVSVNNLNSFSRRIAFSTRIRTLAIVLLSVASCSVSFPLVRNDGMVKKTPLLGKEVSGCVTFVSNNALARFEQV